MNRKEMTTIVFAAIINIIIKHVLVHKLGRVKYDLRFE